MTSLLALGLNHSTSLELRERVAFTPESLPAALASLRESGAREAAILSTCNRTEVYCNASPDPVAAWLARFQGVQLPLLLPNLYMYSGAQAVRHMMRVACGLDSMVPGEPQVFGQLKAAYHIALQAGTVETLLSRLFQVSFATAKRVRSHTAISHNPVSIAAIAVRLAQQVFGALQGRTALFIGAGDTATLAVRHMVEQGCDRIIIANRTLARAEQLARQVQGQAVELSALPRYLAIADIVISSTAAVEPILTLPQVRDVLQAGKARPVLMIDLAVPRDIDPRIAGQANVYLYALDDLRSMIDRNLFQRRQAGPEAEAIIDNQVQHFMDWWQVRAAVPAIRSLHEQAEQERQVVLEEARQRLLQGADPARVLELLAHKLTRRLLHLPTLRLRAEASRKTDVSE